MKIKTRIKQVAEAQDITTAYQLQKAAGLSSSMAARLYRDDVEGLTLRVMESLCDALQCEPGDLFERVADESAVKPQAVKKTGAKPSKRVRQ